MCQLVPLFICAFSTANSFPFALLLYGKLGRFKFSHYRVVLSFDPRRHWSMSGKLGAVRIESISRQAALRSSPGLHPALYQPSQRTS